MKKLFVLLLFFVSNFGILRAQAVNTRLVILPTDISAIKDGYQKGQIDSTSELLFESLYSFIGLLPFVDIPPSSDLRRLKYNDARTLATKYGAKMVIWPEMVFTGDSEAPTAEIIIHVWSEQKKEELFVKKYSSSIDLDIFDMVDRLVLDTISAAFLITPRFAAINFSEFEILEEEYRLYVNNKLIDKVIDSSYNRSLKVLADNKYNIMLIRERDEAVVFNHNITLKEGSVSSVSYKGAASVSFQGIKGAEQGLEYTVLLDGEDIKTGDIVKSLPLTMTHTLLVMSGDGKIQYRKEFILQDGETRKISADLTGKRFYMRFYGLGNSFGGLGMDFILHRKLWTGVDLGYALAINDITGRSVSIISAYLDLNYTILGDNRSNFKIGPALGIGGYYAIPSDEWNTTTSLKPYSLIFRAYVQLNWNIFYFRAGVLMDTQESVSLAPLLTAGIRF